MQPDTLWHYKRLAKQVAADLIGRLKRVELEAEAAGYPQGVDISYWQSDIDFAKLATKAQFCYIRAGYGNDFVDPRLGEYRAGCTANGIPFGLYWYVKPGKDPIKHAGKFFAQWRADPGELEPCFDLEESGGLGKSALDSWLAKMYGEFTRLSGLDYSGLMTYTRASFLDPALGQNGWLKHTNLWVAHWGTTNPIIPMEWAIPNKTWAVHQYSGTGKGSDYGAASRYIDLDRGRYDLPPLPGGEDMKMRVNVDTLNVREGPGTTYADVGDLHKDDVVDMLNVGGTGAWVQIKGGTYDGKWICVQLSSTRYCEPVP